MLGIGFMISYQMGYLEQFFTQEGDVCKPEGTADSNATYILNKDKECVFTCKSGYKKSGGVCIEDTTGDVCTANVMDSRGTYAYNTSGTCVLSSCNEGYAVNGTACAKKLPMAQHVTIERPFGKRISLVEIEVYNQNGAVISSGKTVSGSPSPTSLNNIVDNLYVNVDSTQTGTGSVFGTDAEFPYIQIDLGSLQQIGSIKIIKSMTQYSQQATEGQAAGTTVMIDDDSLKNATVKLLGVDGTTVTAVTPPTNTGKKVAVYDFSAATPIWAYMDGVGP
tara:strand:+ start:364 stop:1197 length:834 start_codon:yes stop_codon:yes gene_type:complete